MEPYEPPTVTYLGRFDETGAWWGAWYPVPMPDVKPTPGRIVLFQPREPGAKPWPAIVVEVLEDKASGGPLCDLFLFPTRGHGPQALRQGVPFSDKPGVRESCSYPPREPSVALAAAAQGPAPLESVPKP